MSLPAHRVYILNSPVLTTYGDWLFEGPVRLDEAQRLLKDGFTSAIGHQGAADFLSALLSVAIPVNRIRAAMEPGDRALVVRILERMPEGKVLTSEEMRSVSYELGILTRKT